MRTKSLPVLFRAEKEGDSKDQVTAVFPTLPGMYDDQDFTIYSSGGQYGFANIEWYNNTRPVDASEYNSLLNELFFIYRPEFQLYVYKNFPTGLLAIPGARERTVLYRQMRRILKKQKDSSC